MRHSLRRTAFLLALGLIAAVVPATGSHAKQYGDWSTASPVDRVNSAATEGCPIEAPDGKSLYLMSTRGPGGDQDIWVAPRTDDGQLGNPEMLPAPVNSASNDFCPTPLRGKWLLFVSDRGGIDDYGTAACGGGDIYLTRWSPATGEWAPPRNLGCGPHGPNGPGAEFGPSLVETDAGTFLYFSSGGGLGSDTQDIYASRRLADGTFGARELVTELSTTLYDDVMPNVRKDGREVVFASTRPGGQGDFDIWSSTRSSTSDPWSAPRNLGTAVNGPGRETRPALSWHGTRLYFGRTGEIYVSNR